MQMTSFRNTASRFEIFPFWKPCISLFDLQKLILFSGSRRRSTSCKMPSLTALSVWGPFILWHPLRVIAFACHLTYQVPSGTFPVSVCVYLVFAKPEPVRGSGPYPILFVYIPQCQTVLCI